jgi:hypothetical protein
VWTPSTHFLFPLKFRQLVKAVLMLGAKRQDGTPYYPQAHLYKLPKEVLFLILQHAGFSTTAQAKQTEKLIIHRPYRQTNLLIPRNESDQKLELNRVLLLQRRVSTVFEATQ